MARFSAVAAQNPHAWFRDALDADAIATVTSTNRMIGFPYPKRMNAILDVDQGAAAILTTAGFARSLGIPDDRFVWWWGGGDAIEDAYFPTERPDLSRAPGLRIAARAALAEAGVTIEEIDLLDLYSCFPVAVRMACEALGIAEDDPRGLTVTGGLPYAGGPGNAYTLMSLATMAGQLRARPGAIGLLTGVGWFLTRHSVGIFASRPPRPHESPRPDDTRPAPPVPVRAGASGAATIVSFTVFHDREGCAERGIVIARLDSGERVLAHLPPDRALLESLEQTETVGRRGTLSEGAPVSRFALD
jgi:acetyl-CoA C-acetyltransferase